MVQIQLLGNLAMKIFINDAVRAVNFAPDAVASIPALVFGGGPNPTTAKFRAPFWDGSP
jgi:hypothetical protein